VIPRPIIGLFDREGRLKRGAIRRHVNATRDDRSMVVASTNEKTADIARNELKTQVGTYDKNAAQRNMADLLGRARNRAR
jgi:hypothetical protein